MSLSAAPRGLVERGIVWVRGFAAVAPTFDDYSHEVYARLGGMSHDGAACTFLCTLTRTSPNVSA